MLKTLINLNNFGAIGTEELFNITSRYLNENHGTDLRKMGGYFFHADCASRLVHDSRCDIPEHQIAYLELCKPIVKNGQIVSDFDIFTRRNDGEVFYYEVKRHLSVFDSEHKLSSQAGDMIQACEKAVKEGAPAAHPAFLIGHLSDDLYHPDDFRKTDLTPIISSMRNFGRNGLLFFSLDRTQIHDVTDVIRKLANISLANAA